MEPENIDWSNIESIFVEDETYEGFKAPKWVDLSVSDELIDDEAWFCNPDCKHPKSAEDLFKSARGLKGKLLRSISVSEIFPFREKSRRDVKLKGVDIKPSSATKLPNMKSKNSDHVCNVHEESENKNPNLAAQIPIPRCNSKSRKAAMTPRNEKKKQGDESSQDSSKHRVKPQLKSAFSASNLLRGRGILNQITEFCTELKNLAKKGSRKETSENNSLMEGARERMPLIVREQAKT